MTRLKALELFGFKSFADRTRFEFPEGITVVVGPNGSGKSNVVDAIKWVLGEQSVRSLRGHDMTDVIFAGSATRKPLNAAETTLIFDNSARQLPVDSDDVHITRRVYRSGENEYLVNGDVSRLRDIRELFSGTGAATQAYSVIEQGRVDALLAASGRERRAVFEEAAGITRFKIRRAESLRRLERSEQNRQRLADIVGEVSSRLETVKHQASRARRWRQMTDRLRALRLSAAWQDLSLVDAAVTSVDESLARLHQEFHAIETDTARATCRTADLLRLEQDLSPQLDAIQSLFSVDKQRAAAAEARLSLLRLQHAEVEADTGRLKADTHTAKSRQREAVAAVEAARTQAAFLHSDCLQIEGQLLACEQAAEGSHQHSADIQQRLDMQAERVELLEAKFRALESEVDRAGMRCEEARRTADLWREKIDAARQLLATLLESLATREGNIDSLARRLANTSHELESAEVAHREQSATLEAAWHTLAGWQAKLEACRERKGMLEEMTAQQEGLSPAAQRLLAASHAQGPRGEPSAVPGLIGLVADLIVAPIEWAPLVDIALGTLGQNLVVESLDDVLRWFGPWSNTEAAQSVLISAGRTGFVSIGGLSETDALDPNNSLEPTALAAHAVGIVGRLDRLLFPDDGLGGNPRLSNADAGPAEGIGTFHRTLARRLLGHVWVVEQLEDARHLLPAVPQGTLCITRAGQCLSTGGLLEIGTPSGATGLVARRSELRGVTQRHDNLLRTVEDASATITELQASLATERQSIRQLQSRRMQEAETIASSRADLDRIGREQLAAREAIAVADAGFLEAQRHLSDRTDALDAASRALETQITTIDHAKRELSQTHASLAALDRNRGTVVEQINRLRIDRATCHERLARAQDAEQRCITEIDARQNDLLTANGRTSAAEVKLDALESELLAAESDFAEAMVAAERSHTEMHALGNTRSSLLVEKTAAAALADAARGAALKLGDSIHAHELEAGEARHRRARIIDRIRDEYDIDMNDEANRKAYSTPEATADSLPTAPTPAASPPTEAVSPETTLPENRDDLDCEIEELRRKLGAMTSVNLEALAEAEALTHRLDTLELQLADVTNAKEAIEQLIARIDDESRRLLGETIETVRGHFRELFERLFGGGQADIVLDPDMDLLETTVEIVARPPGKEPRSISLLSGGEKTMTCVALLLAIFRSRPSPFCVLDEVDAALDESNVDRFVSVLRDFLSSTQFIVVTHSKKTMATATTLYGVTMEESGVSKRVSVRFESTAAAAPLPRSAAA